MPLSFFSNPSPQATAVGRWQWALAVFILLGWLAWALLSLWLAPHPHEQDLLNILQPMGTPGHWLGTDHLGRDLASRLGEALRTSLGLAAASATACMLLGVSLGVWAGWRAGWLDRGLNLLADAASAIPGLLWVLLVAAVLSGERWGLYLGLVTTGWVEWFRHTRGLTRHIAGGDPVQAAQLLGFGTRYQLRWHVWPELLPSLGPLWAYGVSAAVLAVSTLGFVNVGVRPPHAELGVFMTEALPHFSTAPHVLLLPVAALWSILAALMTLSRRTTLTGHEQPPHPLQGQS